MRRRSLQGESGICESPERSGRRRDRVCLARRITAENGPEGPRRHVHSRRSFVEKQPKSGLFAPDGDLLGLELDRPALDRAGVLVLLDLQDAAAAIDDVRERCRHERADREPGVLLERDPLEHEHVRVHDLAGVRRRARRRGRTARAPLTLFAATTPAAPSSSTSTPNASMPASWSVTTAVPTAIANSG